MSRKTRHEMSKIRSEGYLVRSASNFAPGYWLFGMSKKNVWDQAGRLDDAKKFRRRLFRTSSLPGSLERVETTRLSEAK